VGCERAAPQSPQKLASGRLSEPHFGQRGLSALPHRMQNFLPAAFSKSQLEQRIGLPYTASDGLASCSTAVAQWALRIKPAGGDRYQVVLDRSGCVPGEGRQANEP
jgi:hypothetical protein